MILVKTSFTIPKELKQKFKSVCAAIDRNMNEVMREIMNKWLMIQENNLEVDKFWKKASSKN